MTPEYVMALAHQAMIVALSLAGPLLLVALCVGLVIAMFQAATQINEMTLAFIPKLLAVLATLDAGGDARLHAQAVHRPARHGRLSAP